METYWNHNTAFHQELVNDAKVRGGRVLDIGCGDGLLLERLAPFAKQVVGIDPDPKSIVRAQTRLASLSNVSLLNDDFLTMPIPSEEERYSTIICVASLHHMELRRALHKMSQCLVTGGKLLVIGLAADKSIMDKIISGLLILPIRIMDRLHGGMQEIGVTIAEPQESISEIRRAAHDVMPGAIVQRRFYFRYLMAWNKPMIES
ncbi:class I SAM-dependent methyltransferase [Paenibacillus hexagrammi]|uniref:Class I SAM-dependent methyltransferase n=1 Tax=Paenibacillus hexagrammi TaxID=2908839 RepID=A0ABY3SF02_9BACL|nr:class I SAM-dependent methyltransferase [Paenibacillus sp. YPD9-1]UJF31497.1 class I SAM-dependent methyltransferase [Paenibacillus sp. YPD9-1]